MKKRIILVEDEPSIAETIAYALKKEDFLVTHAGSIAESRNQFSQQEFDLVLLDIGLPDGSGLDYCLEIRKNSSIPIFFLTARNDEIDRVLGLELGADDYITKPFSPRELIARIKSLFRRIKSVSEISTNEEKISGPFRVLDDYHQIFLNNTPLDLSRYEFGILKELINSKGRILTRFQIMEKVWEEPEMSLERTIDAHIKSIRKKMRLIIDAEFIITHRGIGYSINLDSNEVSK